MLRLSLRGRVSAALALLCLMIPCCSMAKVIFVATDGDDANDGSDWQHAKRTVQAGIDAAGDGDQIWVAVGTYRCNATLPPGRSLFGGFKGEEAVRDPKSYVTVLDGQRRDSVITMTGGIDSPIALDGFTIGNGLAGHGAGIRCVGVRVTISNCVVTSNYGVLQGVNWAGSGLYCESCIATIARNEFSNNTGTAANDSEAAGLGCYDSQVTITGNLVTGNLACGVNTVFGGGMLVAYSTGTIEGNTIENNEARSGVLGCETGAGGLFVGAPTDMVVRNNTVRFNRVTGAYGNPAYRTRGGGVYLSGLSPYSVLFCDNVVTDNTIVGGSGKTVMGAGVALRGPFAATLASNVIARNVITSPGDGLVFGGGIGFDETGQAHIINNTIVANEVEPVASPNVGGSGIGFIDNSSPAIANNIIAFGIGSAIFARQPSAPVLSHNDLWDNDGDPYVDIPPGPTDFVADPIFFTQSCVSFHIAPQSDCVNSGDDSYIDSGWLDMDGQPRIMGSHVDVGADEVYQGPTYTVSGRLELEWCVGDVTRLPVTVTLHDVTCIQQDRTELVYTDAGCHYSIAAVVLATYDIRFERMPHWLRLTFTGITISGDTDLSVVLTNGDANKDNTVGLGDLSAVLGNFGSTAVSDADLDVSGRVDLIDLSIVLANFDLSGDS